MELKETKHSYYCECYEGGRRTEYNSWGEFVDEGLDYDFDYNLLFRFDLLPHYIYDENTGKEIFTEKYTLQLHHALQRHGAEQWHAVIYNIKQQDLKQIDDFLKKAKEHLLDMWIEIDL